MSSSEQPVDIERISDVPEVYARHVIRAVARHFKINPGDVLASSGLRIKHYARARHITLYLLRKMNYSYPTIQRLLEYNSHQSALMAARGIANMLARGDESMIADVRAVEAILAGFEPPKEGMTPTAKLEAQIAALEVQLRDAHNKIGKLCEWLGIDKDSM